MMMVLVLFSTKRMKIRRKKSFARNAKRKRKLVWSMKKTYVSRKKKELKLLKNNRKG